MNKQNTKGSKDFSARQVGVLLESMDKNIKIIAEQHGGIVGRLDKIDKKLEDHDRRFDKMDQRFDKMDQRFDDMDRQFVELKAEVNQIGTFIVKSHEKRITKVEEKLGLAQ